MIVSLTRTPVTGSEGLETCDSDRLLNSDNHGVGGASGVSQNGGLNYVLGSRTNFYVWTLDSWVVFQYVGVPFTFNSHNSGFWERG